MAPSIIDVQFVATMERVIASCLYWKGLHYQCRHLVEGIRREAKLLATKSDIYSIVSATPYKQVIFEADEAHRHEAAFALVDMHDAIIAFAASRGAGEAGRPSFHAQLADPFAEPNEEFVIPVDVGCRGAAAQFRAHLNWAIALLNCETS